MKHLLNAILTRIKNLVPSIQYVDVDWGQLDAPADKRPPVKWPCAIVDITDVEWSSFAQGWQQGVATIRITVAQLRLSRSSSGATVAARAKAFAFYDLMNEVHRAMQGFRPTDMSGTLNRTAYQNADRRDGLDCYRIIYTVALKEPPAEPASVEIYPEYLVNKE